MQNLLSNFHLYLFTSRVKYFFLAFLGIVFFIQLVSSLSWRLDGDTSFMHYVAYLINEHGLIPYRDIFEINMPGAYLFHMVVGKLFGYSDFAFRIVDFIWISTTLTVTWLMMKPMGPIVAIASCLLFGNIYLGRGSYMSLNRDIISILPMATALLISTRRPSWWSIQITSWLLGVLFALAALVKPHMVIGLPAIILYSTVYGDDNSKSITAFIQSCLIGSFFALLGFLSTLAVPFLWVWHIGALQSFWDIFSSFTPLYARLSRNLELMEAFPRFKYAIEHYLLFGRFRILIFGSLLGIFFVWTGKLSPVARKLSITLFSFTILYSIYVAIGGKFWGYHWMPFVYFASLCTACILYYPISFNRRRLLSSFFSLITFFSIAVLTVKPFKVTANHFWGDEPFAPTLSLPLIERADEMTAYLNKNLSSTDTVQALDWGGGALYAMLRSQAVTATPYITDFQFYHHVSNPYIQQLRKDFMEQINENKPTFILDVYARVRVKGIDVSYQFPELEKFIRENYRKDYEGDGFNVFKLISL